MIANVNANCSILSKVPAASEFLRSVDLPHDRTYHNDRSIPDTAIRNTFDWNVFEGHAKAKVRLLTGAPRGTDQYTFSWVPELVQHRLVYFQFKFNDNHEVWFHLNTFFDQYECITQWKATSTFWDRELMGVTMHLGKFQK